MAALARLSLLVALFSASVARAAPPPSGTDEADALFEEGRRLMDQGQLVEACTKLERSFQLAPRLGTMLNLGGCLERRGQLARALALYERAATLARQLGRPDREAAAREYAASVEGRVAKLLVIIEDTSLEVATQVDGETISTRSGLVPLDPGQRRLSAGAPGRVPFEITLDLQAGRTTTVTVPHLREVPRPPPPRPVAPPPPPPAPSGPSVRTWVMLGGFGLAAAGAGVGAYFGLHAKTKYDASNGECNSAGCTDRGLALIDEAKSAGSVSTVAFVVAGVGLGGAVTALLVSKPSAPARAALVRAGNDRAAPLRVDVSVVPSFGGALIRGAF